MAVVVVAHRNPALRGLLRQGFKRRGVRVVGCRTRARLAGLLRSELVDAVVLGATAAAPEDAGELVRQFPRIPWFVAGSFRPDDGPALLAYRQRGVRGILVDGVDDHAAPELVAACGASRMRRAALEGASKLLRLTEPRQVQAWEVILQAVGRRLSTAQVARALGISREHLSREFAAGGAPNIKRVMDLARVLCAVDLLGNPGYTVATVAEILRFSSASHLAACTQRVAGARPGELVRLGMQGVLARFLRGRTRSRL
jgi:AraC-like DNA-binding protein